MMIATLRRSPAMTSKRDDPASVFMTWVFQTLMIAIPILGIVFSIVEAANRAGSSNARATTAPRGH
jgi:hypothetical protein